MSLVQRALLDTQKIVSNPLDFGEAATFTAPDNTTVDTYVIHAKHHTSFDELQLRVNSKIASVCVSEAALVDYPYRAANGEVNLKNHKVAIKDSTGIVKNYLIREWFPDETVGIIVCILGDFV